MVARIERRKQAIRMPWVTHRLIEVDHCIEVAWCADPAVHGLAVCLTRSSGVIKRRADERKNRCTDHLDAMSMRSRNNLLVGAEDSTNERLMLCRRHVAVAG